MLINTPNNKKIRFHFIMGLVFSFLLLGCAEKKQQNKEVTIDWPKGIVVPMELIPETSRDSIEQLLHIQLHNANVPILGEYIVTNDAVTFQPLIPFTPGLKYEVYFANKLLSVVEIPIGHLHASPELVNIYPVGDTLPVNLLKIHIAFSKPMREGEALEHIIVIKNGKDTVPSIFLDLQPELWNKERTMLTLWLDPGRIKRDLIPNKKLGSPLEQGATYEIVIKRDWQGIGGDSLFAGRWKKFVVGSRDSLSPDPDAWTLYPPEARSKHSLKIDLHESLDYVLLKNTIRVVDSAGKVLNGIIDVDENGSIVQFTSDALWIAGNYTLEVESRLEDLAGNNLNRLFDRDITKQGKKEQKEIYKRSFQVK